MSDVFAQRRRHNQMLIDRVQGVPAVETGAASENDPNAPAPTGDSAGNLLPCPFCGGDADLSKGQKGDGSPWHYVECFKCASMAEPDVWNTRQPPQPTGDVGELVERLDWIKTRTDYIDDQKDIEMARVLLTSLNSRLADTAQAEERWRWLYNESAKMGIEMKARAEAAEQAIERIQSMFVVTHGAAGINCAHRVGEIYEITRAALTGAGEMEK